MNLHLIDWCIVGGLFVFTLGMAIFTRRYTHSVADFLAANRCAGRYMLSLSEGIAVLGAISIVALWQMYYEAGFTAAWWLFLMLPLTMVRSALGWVIYRYRQTRAMTMAQFFEMRYSRRFRVFAGILAFVCGIVNFGIFPSVGARFFIYFCDLPEYIPIFGIDISSYVLVMVILLTAAITFTWLGGQIAVLVTDFFQGIFCNVVFLVILAGLVIMIDWNHVGEVFINAPQGKSMINPLSCAKHANFNPWYFIISAFACFYAYMSWQGMSGYNCSAKNAHEARMAKILSTWRGQTRTLLMLLLPVFAYVVMHHSDYSNTAATVKRLSQQRN